MCGDGVASFGGEACSASNAAYHLVDGFPTVAATALKVSVTHLGAPHAAPAPPLAPAAPSPCRVTEYKIHCPAYSLATSYDNLTAACASFGAGWSLAEPRSAEENAAAYAVASVSKGDGGCQGSHVALGVVGANTDPVTFAWASDGAQASVLSECP